MKKIFAVLTAVMLAAGMLLPALPAAAAEPLEIVNGPSNYVVPEGMNVTYSVNATGSDLRYEWFLRYGGADYPLMDTPETISASWHDYVDAVTLSPTGADITLENVKYGLDGSKIYCIVNGSGSVAVTGLAYISVQKTTSTTLRHITPFGVKHLVSTTLDKLVKVPVKIVEEDGYTYKYQWYETHDGRLETIKALPYEDSMVLIPDTSAVGTRYYVCMVETYKGNQRLHGYTEVCKINVSDPGEDSSFTSGVDLQSKPKKLSYKGGEAIDLTGIKMRVYSEQGFFDLTDKSKINVYPNNVYSPEQKRLVAEYDGFAAEFGIKVEGGASAGGSFSIYPVSEQEYYTYSPNKAFSLEAAAKDANGEVSFVWYKSNKDGERKEICAQGSKLNFPNGLKMEEEGILNYYLCVATCDGKEETLLFYAILMAPDYNPPDDPTPSPSPSPSPTAAAPVTPVPATVVPATVVPATSVPATGAPATDAPATAEPGGDATLVPDDDATAVPGGDTATAPGDNAATAPGSGSGNEKDRSARKAELLKSVLLAGGIIGGAAIICVLMVIVSKKKK